MDRLSSDLYVLSQTQNPIVRYAPLFVHGFALCAPRKILDAAQFNQRYRRYDEIENVPDRLRWLRHSRGLIQAEVAKIGGVTKAVYMDIECGETQCIPREMMEKLARFYVVPESDFLDEFNRFLLDGQADRIRGYRESLGLNKKAFARELGIPIRSLRDWEGGKKVVSKKSWETYFKGKI